MPPPSKKRSHEDIIAETDPIQSSATIVGDVDLLDSQNEPSIPQANPPASEFPSTLAHTMDRPVTPVPSMPPPSNKPPQSAQRVPKSQVTQQQTPESEGLATRTARKTQSSDETIGNHDEERSQDIPSSPSDPQDEIEDFDWSDLQLRYHNRMIELNAKEQGIFAEFNDLCGVGTFWPTSLLQS